MKNWQKYEEQHKSLSNLKKITNLHPLGIYTEILVVFPKSYALAKFVHNSMIHYRQIFPHKEMANITISSYELGDDVGGNL